MWRRPPVSIRRHPPFIKRNQKVVDPMATDSTLQPLVSRRPMRADARRNYDKLIAAAREAFTEDDSTASLEDIARRAGVGIGTLYRHFPTRKDLLAGVYEEE